MAGPWPDTPAGGVMIAQVLSSGNPTDDHCLSDPPFFRTGGEVDVGDGQTNKRYSNQAMNDIDVAPC